TFHDREPRPPGVGPHAVDGVAMPIVERLSHDGMLSEYWSKRLLASFGIPVPQGGMATTLEQAMHVAEDLGYPVAIKATAPHLMHKTELGLVRLHVADAADLRRACEDLWTRGQAHLTALHPGALEGVLIEQMVLSGVEVVIGARRSEFGPVVMFGAGGVLAELIADTSHRLAPLSDDEALAMVRETRAGRLLAGYRGAPLDVRAVARVLQQVVRLVGDLGEFVEAVDINPVMVTTGGLCAVDAVVYGRRA
ncbi:MAG: acetate--CoA ligase family protein, partial [Armatimonadota bacterium]